MTVFESAPVNSAKYQADHKRVRLVRGDVRLRDCIADGCDDSARDWAWIHGKDPSDPENYRPMCRVHHQEYDRAEWLVEERKKERERIESGRSFKGWTPERREAQRQRMLDKWASPEERLKQSERAKADEPWKGRRPKKGGGLR